jgi:hypothetical protein
MTPDEIKHAAMTLVAELKLPPKESVAAYAGIVAFGSKVAEASKLKRKRGAWTDAQKSALRADPVRMKFYQDRAAKARQGIVAKALGVK